MIHFMTFGRDNIKVLEDTAIWAKKHMVVRAVPSTSLTVRYFSSSDTLRGVVETAMKPSVFPHKSMPC